MNGPPSHPEARPQTEGKPRWERPALTFLGDLKDLVRGAGKLTGPPNDSDMTSMRKSPGQT